MSWTAERVELLTKLWAEGLSASQIAAELGNVTRNAVIGKVHRLGLSGRAKSGGSGGAAKARKQAPAPTPAASVTTTTRASVSAPTASIGEPARQEAAPIKRMAQAPVSGATALKIEPELQENEEIGNLPAPEIFIPVNERASILTLNERTCKWPIGDPGSDDFYFCGRQSDGGTPYCAHHRAIAYQPVNDRRRDRKAAS
ncbi:GcrA family cell cycle regulator [Polycladidibacter stylochi]|uniref:GcrA family cell cycle regulator n=1 Tax=Polycladidibacter stylochi TaxID=1807766 RepID=UPI000836BAE4|nr:GcrA family cell cycle regulator [Pseudovibrio stylochi]